MSHKYTSLLPSEIPNEDYFLNDTLETSDPEVLEDPEASDEVPGASDEVPRASDEVPGASDSEALEDSDQSSSKNEKFKPKRKKLYSHWGVCKNIALNIITLAISALILAYAIVSWQANGTNAVGAKEQKLLEIAKYVSY
jgi:hypothetical protein